MPHALIFSGSAKMNADGAVKLQRAGGAHKIATWLRSQSWDVEVLDYFFGWTLEELQEFCKSRVTTDTVFIGWSAVFATNDARLTNFISWFKNEYPAIKIIAGGQDVILTNIDAHYYIDGYGEYAIKAVIDHILKKEKLTYTIWNKGKLVKANISYPAYPMEDLPIRYEARDYIDPYETLPFELSRGCKFQCTYCNYPILGVKGDYSRVAEGFKDELIYVYENFGVTKFNVADETINDRTEKLEKFANVSQQLNFKPWLNGFVRFDLMVSRKQDWELLAGMNLFGQHYGIDTFNWETGKAVGKGMNPEKIKKGLVEVKEYFKKLGPYKGSITMVGGLPKESKESLRETFKWAQDNWTGESFKMFPLWLSKGTITKSIIANNFEESGYSEMTDEEIQAEHEKNPGTDLGVLSYKNSRIRSSMIFWKNEHTNFIEVERMIAAFQKENRDRFSLLGWNLGETSQVYRKPIEEIFEHHFKSDTTEEEKQQVVRTYIDKKLGYS